MCFRTPESCLTSECISAAGTCQASKSTAEDWTGCPVKTLRRFVRVSGRTEPLRIRSGGVSYLRGGWTWPRLCFSPRWPPGRSCRRPNRTCSPPARPAGLCSRCPRCPAPPPGWQRTPTLSGITRQKPQTKHLTALKLLKHVRDGFSVKDEEKEKFRDLF